MIGDLDMPKMDDFGVRSPGHEGAGVVVKLGENVTGWKLGDRAGMKPIFDVCHQCELCWGDKECYCPKATHTGLMVPGTYTNHLSRETTIPYNDVCAHNPLGSYQQYIRHPARYASPIPDGVSDTVAGPIMCSASTIYRSLVESELRPGDIAVFPGGAGGVGIQGVQLARAMGLRVIVVDSGADKRALATKMGAEAFVDFRDETDVGAAVVKAADGVGAHGVFVTAPAAYGSAVALTGTRIGAKVMCIGLPPKGSTTLGADPALFAFRNLTVKGTLVGSMRDTHMALDYARRGLLKQICEVVPLARMPEAVERLRKGQVAGRIVVDFNARGTESKL